MQQNGQASPAIADTGTSLVLVDDVVARGYWTQVAGARVDGGQGGWVFPCEAQLPDLKLDFGGNVGVVGGGLMNFAQVADGSELDPFFLTAWMHGGECGVCGGVGWGWGLGTGDWGLGTGDWGLGVLEYLHLDFETRYAGDALLTSHSLFRGSPVEQWSGDSDLRGRDV